MGLFSVIAVGLFSLVKHTAARSKETTDPEAQATKAELSAYAESGSSNLQAKVMSEIIKEMILVEAAELEAIADGKAPDLQHFSDWTPEALFGLREMLSSLHDVTKWGATTTIPKTPKEWGVCALCDQKFPIHDRRGNPRYCEEHNSRSRLGDAARAMVSRQKKKASHKSVT